MVEDSENDVYEADRQEIHDGHKEQQTAATWESQWFTVQSRYLTVV